MKTFSVILILALALAASAMSRVVTALGHLAAEHGADIHAAMDAGELIDTPEAGGEADEP